MAKKETKKVKQARESINQAIEYILGSLSAIDNYELKDIAESFDVLEAMYHTASLGIKPYQYALFYDIFCEATSERAEEIDQTEHSLLGNSTSRRYADNQDRFSITEYEPMADASEFTLKLKIQLQHVNKPPMWREVDVPADYDFAQLHEIIQEVTGLDNYHLWQFGVKEYDDSLVIGVCDGPAAIEGVTHDASDTYLTQFFQKKGDKLIYEYDFGDDWIFKIEVKDVIKTSLKFPICRKFKSELNLIEDSGGPWRYMELRELLNNWEIIPKKERRKEVDNWNFNSEDEFLEFLNEYLFNLDDTNDWLEINFDFDNQMESDENSDE